jgi:hypothetical protein
MATRVKTLDKPAGAGTAVIEMIPVRELGTDPAVNTRPVDDAWVAARVAVYNPAGVGTLTVSRRGDGELIILDGQHRAELMRMAAGTGAVAQCEVYQGLTVSQEAAIFRLLNDKRALTPLHRFLALLTEGDPSARAVSEIADRCGWVISDTGASGSLRCVGAVQKIHRLDRARKAGASPVALERTLACITGTWGTRGDSGSAVIIAGIGAVFVHYEETVKPAVMTDHLKLLYREAADLAGKARGLAQYDGGSTANSVSKLAVRGYNRKLSTGRIPGWRGDTSGD